MKLALVALVETTVVVSEKKKEKKRREKASVSRHWCKGCCLAFVQYFEFLQFKSP